MAVVVENRQVLRWCLKVLTDGAVGTGRYEQRLSWRHALCCLLAGTAGDDRSWCGVSQEDWLMNRDLCVSTAILYVARCHTGSQCSWFRMDVMWSCFLAEVIALASEFCTCIGFGHADVEWIAVIQSGLDWCSWRQFEPFRQLVMTWCAALRTRRWQVLLTRSLKVSDDVCQAWHWAVSLTWRLVHCGRPHRLIDTVFVSDVDTDSHWYFQSPTTSNCS